MNFVPKTVYEKNMAEMKCYLSERQYREKQKADEAKAANVNFIIEDFLKV